MQRATFSGLFAIVAATALVAGCSSVPDKKDFSGYLKDYSDLKEAQNPNGEKFLRYANPKFTPANYNAAMIQKVEFYPKPEPTDQVSQATLDQISNYLTDTLRQKVGEKVQVVDKPGPGVAKVQVALTGVAPQDVGLKPYQYVPIALIVTGVKRGVSGTPQEAHLVVESQVTDSVSNEILAKSVRAGVGEELKKEDTGEHNVTLDSLKPLIDKWAQEVSDAVGTFIKAK